MKKAIKINYYSLGKPTSTTIDYALAEFYVNSVSDTEASNLNTDEIRKIIQNAVNLYSPDRRDELTLSKYYIERLLLEIAKENYIKKASHK